MRLHGIEDSVMRKWFKNHKARIYSIIGLLIQIIFFPITLIGFGCGYWNYAIGAAIIYCIGIYQFIKWDSFIDP